MATKEEKDAYKGDPKLLLEALTGAPGKNGPCPLTKSEAAFYVWNYVVVSPSKAAECHDAIPLLIHMLKNPDATDDMIHSVAGALAYLARVEDHRAEIAVNPVPTILANLLSHRTSDSIPQVASQCLLELCNDEECRKSSAMQAAVPALLTFVRQRLPRCAHAEQCSPTLVHVLKTMEAMTSAPGPALSSLVAEAADTNPPKYALLDALTDGASIAGDDKTPRSLAACLLARCLADAFDGSGKERAAAAAGAAAGAGAAGGALSNAARAEDKNKGGGSAVEPREPSSGATAAAAAATNHAAEKETEEEEEEEKGKKKNNPTRTYARAGAFPDDVRTRALERGALRALLRLCRMEPEGADDEGRMAAVGMLRLYMRDYEGVAARVVRDGGEGLLIRMLSKPPPPPSSSADDGGNKGGKKGGGGGGKKKKKEPPMSPAVAEAVKHAVGCISLLTSLGFHKELTSGLHSATDQLDALQESDDEMTRRYARQALWNLKFFEVPSSVASHFQLTEDDAGEIVVSPNTKKPATATRGRERGEGIRGGEREEGAEQGSTTRAFRDAYQTPASARVAYMAGLGAQEGSSLLPLRIRLHS